MRTMSSILRRKVVTQSGASLGRVYDLRGVASPRTLSVTGMIVGKRGLLEHLGIVRRARPHIPWEDVVRIEGKRIVVRDR